MNTPIHGGLCDEWSIENRNTIDSTKKEYKLFIVDLFLFCF